MLPAMSQRRILSLWFPRLGAERLMRRMGLAPELPFAVVGEAGNALMLRALSVGASAAGLRPGQPLRDAQAMCPALLTRPEDRAAEAAFLTVLRRWAGQFSPWVAEEAPDGLMIDLTGCAHLFGGEPQLVAQIEQDCADLGLSLRAGLADTVGAAWALARYAGAGAEAGRSGDAIEQEARATRARAAKRRHWERGGAAPATPSAAGPAGRIAPPGQSHMALRDLPVTALRLDPEMVEQLTRLGLRRIGDLAGQPRASLARRFGKGLVLRLDQAFGSAPEPVSPAKPPPLYAVRLTLPEPIGLESDILAALDRMLPRLATHLEAAGRGARRVRLQVFRTDHTQQSVEVALARASANPDRLRPLLEMKIGDLDAGFGIDMIRLEAVRTEPIHAKQAAGHLEAARRGAARQSPEAAIDDLMGRIGARIGIEAITRRHPGNSHIPEKSAQVLAAAWSEPARDWPAPPAPRPLLLWRPEPIAAPEHPTPPAQFRWRGRDLTLAEATGPERIAPEWWLDEPDWRSGVRDYWQVVTAEGDRLWLYYAHGAAMSAGWFCQGSFA